ncbi:hypothetical protein DdX_17780 [Ditylenchus destructor]|uniref:Uncharacterized protein n=1 Tax=Ditylenchus destructor TaxID=166010 RepID=A0AAD4QVH1_9BILA|nr:hypothetical protein DdX_17780 [Ditylenchus destructor]
MRTERRETFRFEFQRTSLLFKKFRLETVLKGCFSSKENIACTNRFEICDPKQICCTSSEYRRDTGFPSGGSGERCSSRHSVCYNKGETCSKDQICCLSDSSETSGGSNKSSSDKSNNNLNPNTKSELKRDLNKLQDELRKITAKFGVSTS